MYHPPLEIHLESGAGGHLLQQQQQPKNHRTRSCCASNTHSLSFFRDNFNVYSSSYCSLILLGGGGKALTYVSDSDSLRMLLCLCPLVCGGVVYSICLPEKGEGEGSRDSISSDKGRNGNHGSPSVLDLLQLELIGDGELEGVPSDITGESTSLKTGGNRLAVLDFSVSVGEFVDLNGSNKDKHLGKSLHRSGKDGIDGLHRLEVGEFDVVRHRQVVMDAELVEGKSELVLRESEGTEHGCPSVLDLGGLDEFTSLGGSPLGSELVPDSLSEEKVGEDERSVRPRLLNNGGSGNDRLRDDFCGRLSLLRHAESGGGAGEGRLLDRGKGGNAAHKRGEQGKLHRRGLRGQQKALQTKSARNTDRTRGAFWFRQRTTERSFNMAILLNRRDQTTKETKFISIPILSTAERVQRMFFGTFVGAMTDGKKGRAGQSRGKSVNEPSLLAHVAPYVLHIHRGIGIGLDFWHASILILRSPHVPGGKHTTHAKPAPFLNRRT